MRPSCSIVIPAYQGAAYIGAALESVFAQTELPCEVIVVDDASPDGTAGIAESMSKAVPVSVRVIRLSRNSGGPAHPINVGVEAARGELISVLDQDDVLLPQTLERHVSAHAETPHAPYSVVLGANMQDERTPLPARDVLDALMRESRETGGVARTLEGQQVLRLLLLHHNFIWGFPGFVFRRRCWEQVGGVQTAWRGAADFDFLCALSTLGPVAFIPEIGFLRREHAGNLTTVAQRSSRNEMVRISLKWIDAVADTDEQFVRDVRRKLLVSCRRLRDRGGHLPALRGQIAIMRRLGVGRDALAALLKLPVHWICAQSGCLQWTRRAWSALTSRVAARSAERGAA
jgi:glycosyltransferase involved in cell wall biosynthesis